MSGGEVHQGPEHNRSTSDTGVERNGARSSSRQVKCSAARSAVAK